MWVLDMDVDKVQSVVIICASYLTYKPMSIIDTAVNVTIRITKAYLFKDVQFDILCLCFQNGIFRYYRKAFLTDR